MTDTEKSPVTVPPPYQDCLSCRIVGTGTLAGVGSYALWASRQATPPGAVRSGNLLHKRMLTGIGTAFLVGSVIRWFQ